MTAKGELEKVIQEEEGGNKVRKKGFPSCVAGFCSGNTQHARRVKGWKKSSEGRGCRAGCGRCRKV